DIRRPLSDSASSRRKARPAPDALPETPAADEPLSRAVPAADPRPRSAPGQTLSETEPRPGRKRGRHFPHAQRPGGPDVAIGPPNHWEPESRARNSMRA